MHPVLFEIVGLRIHTYGLMLALGFLAALFWIRYQSRREGLAVGKMIDFAFLLIIAAIIGSRLLFVIKEWRYYLENPLHILEIWEGGLIFYGGLIGCIITAWIYLKKYHLSFWKVSDVFMPGVALGHAIGRVGCFFAGCCHGRQCDPHAWYAVIFPAGKGSLAPVGIALYPTQILEAIAEFLTFLFLAWKSRKKAFDGQILLLYLIIYSVIRIGIEFLRGDLERGYVIRDYLSTSQLISLILIILALIMIIFRRGRSS